MGSLTDPVAGLRYPPYGRAREGRRVAPGGVTGRCNGQTATARPSALVQKLLGVVAGHRPAGERPRDRPFLAAAVGGVGAAGREHAALRGIERRGQFAPQDDPLAGAGADPGVAAIRARV